MKGLLVKELYTLNPYRKSFLFMIVLVVGMSVFTDIGNTYVSVMLMMFFMVISMNLFAVDENAAWDRCALTLPVTRLQIVATRYLFVLGSLACLFAFSFLLSWGVNLIKPQGGGWAGQALAASGAMSLCALFAFSVIGPLCYKFGAEKSRILMIVVFLLPYAATVFALPTLIPFLQSLSQALISLLVAGGVALVLVLYLLSAFISTRIYAKKEY